MKKKLTTLLVALCSTFAAIGFASCDITTIKPDSGTLEEVGSYTVELDSTKFDPLMSYGQEFDFEGLTLLYSQTLSGGIVYETTIGVNADMIVSGGATDSVGDQQMVIAYEDQTWTIDYTVKYQVDFVANGQIFDTQYVLDIDEVVVPDPSTQAKEDYVFAYWKTEIPETLSGNLTIEAHYYDTKKAAPALQDFALTYAPNLALKDLALPFNDCGYWEFIADENTLLGDVGAYEFDVRFVPATDELPPVADSKVSVEVQTYIVDKPALTSEQSTFTYDGSAKTVLTDTYEFYTVSNNTQTNAGTYTVALELKDSKNYAWSTVNPDPTFTILPKEVTFEIKNENFVYDGKAHSPDYDPSEDIEITESIAPQVNAGTYEYELTIEDKNYTGGYKGSFTILPKEVTFEIKNEDFVYDGEAHFPDYEPSEDIEITESEVPQVNAGTYAYELTIEDKNYTGGYEGSFTIARKQVTFTVTKDSFVYDGEEHYPEYTVSDENAPISESGRKRTEVGDNYAFALSVSDPNYVGSYRDTFAVTKAEVTIVVHDQKIKYPAAIPALTYEVKGFANADILDIEIEKPASNNVGEYVLNATVGNKNVEATIIPGTLTIEKGDLATLIDPVLSTDATEFASGTPAIYEDTLSTVAFVSEALGTWEWKYPDTIIDDMNGITAIAVFTSQNVNYNVVERELSITNIAKRKLEIKVLENEYVYSGNEVSVQYEISGGDLTKLTVTGNIGATDADTYERTLRIVSDCYEGQLRTHLTIHKATPNVSLEENEASVEYTPYLTLDNSKIELQGVLNGLEGTFAWKEKNTTLSGNTIGEEYTYQVVYTPTGASAKNYTEKTLDFSVTVIKASASVVGVQDEYSYVYNGNVFTLDSAKVQDSNGYTNNDSDLVITYQYQDKNGNPTEIKNVGEYYVVISASETAHYTSASKTVKVTVTQAENAWSTAPYMTDYSWSFVEKAGAPYAKANFGFVAVSYKNTDTNEVTSTMPTNAGNYQAIFTVESTENYKGLTATKNFTITQAIVTKPSLEKNSFVYTGGTIEAVVVPAQSADADLYTVAGNTATNAGVHTITLTLKDGDNYNWNNDADTTTLVFNITKAPNSITGLAIEGWQYLGYNEQTNAPSIESASFGASKVQYSYYASRQNATSGENAIADISTAEVGTYYVKAEIAEEATYGNYAYAYAIKEFSIVKADPNVQVSLNKYTVEWHSLLTLKNSGITLNGGDAHYAWISGDEKISSGEEEYQIVYTPDDTKNYNTKTFTVKINVTKRVISKPTATYTQNAQTCETAPQYNGEEWTLSAKNVLDSAYYTFEAGKGTARGNYTVELTLVYPNDTEWEEGFDGKVAYEILQADNAITSLTLNGWTYGNTANKPSVKAAFGANTAVYTYASAKDGEYTTTVPTQAGDYWVKAAIAETNDYKGAEYSEAVSFTIAEATYTGNVTFTANYQTLTWTDSLTLASANVTLGGAVGDGTLTGEFAWASDVDMSTELNAGDNVFAVVCKIKNYLPVEGTVTIQVSADKIAKPTLAITDGVTTIEGNPIYSGNEWKAAAQSDTFYEVTYTQGVKNAGSTITVKIELKDSNHVWADGTNAALTATYTIQKASVETPQNPASVEYTGKEQTVTITETALYKAATISGKYAGAYTKALELQDPTNYQWKDGTGEVTFTITQASASKLTVTASMENWTYQETASTLSATATVGEVAIENGAFTYQYFDSYKDALTARPSDAGTYYVKATLIATDDYASATSEYVKFTIAQATHTPPKPTDLTATYGDTLGSVSLATNDTRGVWTWENASTKVGDAGTQTHYAVYTYTSEQDANNFKAVARQAFTVTVAEKALTVSLVAGQTFTYNGSNQKDNVQYVITDENGKTYNNLFVSVQVKHNTKDYTEFKNAGAYTLTITIQEDNYVGELKYNSLTMGKATPTVSVSMDDWTYGVANVPQTMTNNTDGNYTVSYQYATTEDGEYTPITDFGTLDAGDYFVKATVSETENYFSVTTLEADAFSIEKAKVAVPTIASKTYTGGTLKADVSDTDDYTVETNAGGVNVGSNYAVVLKLKNSTNYVWANGEEESVSLTFSITKAELTITNVSVVSWTYKEDVKTPVITVKDGIAINEDDIVYCYYDAEQGEYKSWNATQYKVEMAKLNAGTYAMQVYVKESGNYLASNRLNTSIFINKAKVEVPSFEDKTYAENANHEAIHQNSGLTETNDYTVFEDFGGTSKGTYQVILKLKDYTNYEWVFGAESRAGTIEYNQVTIKYTIAAAANVWLKDKGPDITRSWEFDKETGTVTMPEAEFGNNEGAYKVQVLYTGKPYGNRGDYSSTVMPTLAGKYTVTFSVAANEGEWTALSTSIDFTITKQVVALPEIVAKDYTGDPLTADAKVPSDLYTIKQEDWINKGEHTVTVTLENANDYTWVDDESDPDTTVTFTINQATTKITSLTIADWTFNEAANEPEIETNVKVSITEETYYYYDKDKILLDKNNPHKAPTLAGDYFVKAIIEETNNYTKKESDFVSFKIIPANYTETVTYTVNYPENFEWRVGLTLENSNITLTPNSPATAWAWKTEDTALVAGENSVEVIFTINSNYNPVTTTITVNVPAKKIATPSLAITDGVTTIKGNPTYSGNVWKPVATETSDYTVSYTASVVNAGQTITITFTPKANRAWSDSDFNGEVSYTVQKVKNNRVIELNATYGQTLAAIADQLTAFNEADKGTWTWSTASGTLPSNVGEYTYYAQFQATDTTNYESYETVPVTVVVSAKVIEKPSFAITDGVTNIVGNPTYSGNVWTAYAESNPDYEVKVTYSKTSDAAGKDALQTITITFTLKQDNEDGIINRVWKESFDTTIEYTIQPADHKVTSLGVTGWTYGEYNQSNEPSATVTATAANTGNKTYYYRKVDSTEWIAWDNVNAPASKAGAGTYELAVSIEGTTNYNALAYYMVENDTFTIAKATVTASLADDELEYTGGPANLEVIVQTENGTKLMLTTDYTVPTAATNYGLDYEIMVTLTEEAYVNYAFANDSQTATLTYSITTANNAWADKDGPSIKGWEYGVGTGTLTLPELNFSNDNDNTAITVTYYNTKTGDSYTEEGTTIPADMSAGSYEVTITVSGNANGNWAEFVDTTLKFTIEQQSVDISGLGLANTDDLIYNGTYQLPTTLGTLTHTNGEATVTGTGYVITITMTDYNAKKADGVVFGEDAGTYEIKVSLANDNYKWSDAKDEEDRNDKVFTYTIRKATNTPILELTDADADTNGIQVVYTSNPIEPELTAANKAGKQYSYTSDNTNWPTGCPTDVGTYTVKVEIPATDNYEAGEDTINFTIIPADYTETVTYTVNYPADLEWSDSLTLENSGITLTPNSPATAWEWKTKDTDLNAGDNEVEVIFTISKNYNPVEQTITVTIAPKQVATPSLAITDDEGVTTTTSNPTYSGNVWKAVASSNEDYDVAYTPNIDDAGETITITFTLKANRAWAESFDTTPTYTVQKANHTVTSLGVTGWMYGEYNEANNKPTSTVTATAANTGTKTYYYRKVGDTNWTSWNDATKPARAAGAGTYQLAVDIAQSTNYNAVEKHTVANYTFTIEQAVVTLTDAHKALTDSPNLKYNGNNQLPNSVENNGDYGDYTAIITATALTGDSDSKIDNFGTDAATYVIEFELEDSTNYVWANGTKTTYTYTIGKENNAITALEIAGKTYDGQSVDAETTATFGADKAVYSYYGTNMSGTEAKGNGLPVNAGNYTQITVKIAGTDNYNEIEKSFNVSIDIEKAGLTINGGTQTSTTEYYENQISDWWSAEGDTAPSAVRYGTTQVVAGTFTYTVEFSQDLTKKSKINYTFTPTSEIDKNNYAAITKEDGEYFELYLQAVACIDTTYYGSIESALGAASSDDTVWVLTNANNGGNVMITADAEIASGVTLILPYGGTVGSFTTNSSRTDGKAIYEATLYNANSSSITYDENGKPVGHPDYATLKALECVTRVTIASGITLTVNGTLEIGGELSGSGGAAAYAGHTARYYAEIIMRSNAQIIVTEENTGNQGVVRCFGFIHEGKQKLNDAGEYVIGEYVSDLSNGSKVTVNAGGTISMPYVLNDFRGGAYMTAVYAGSYLNALASNFGTSQVSPFNQFELRNVTSLLQVNYGGFLIGYANLYANAEQNATQVQLIGNTQDYLIELTKTQYSYVTAKYNAHIQEYTAQNGEAYCDLRIYGGADINKMELVVKTSIKTVEVTTDVVYFPLSWRYHITLGVAEGQASATYNANHKFKMLPGNKLTVAQGATLNIQELSIYEEFPVKGCVGISSSGTSTIFADYPDKGAAILTVNGTLNATALGGKVYSTEPGAVLKVTTAESIIKEAKHAESDYFSDNSVYNDNQTNLLSLSRYGGGDNYTSADTYYSAKDTDGKWKWISSTKEFNITYKFCDVSGNIITSDSVENKAASTFTYGQTLVLASASYTVAGKIYIFKGWHQDENGAVNFDEPVQQIVGKDNFDKNVVLWGVFEEVTEAYTVIFDKSNTPDGYELATLDNMNIATYEKALTSFNPYNLTAWAMCKYDKDYTASHYFVGWYYLNANGEEILINDTNHLKSNYFADVEGQTFKSVTLHDKWEAKYHYTFDDCKDGEVFGGDGKIHLYLMEEDIDTFSFESHVESITQYDSEITKSYRFVSWEDEDNATIFAALPYQEGKKEYVISAVWEAKEYTLVVNGPYGGNGGTPTLPNTETSMLGTFYMNGDQIATVFGWLQSSATSRDTNIDYDSYFVNWTYDGGSVTELSKLQDQETGKSYADYFKNGQFTITANWAKKIGVTLRLTSYTKMASGLAALGGKRDEYSTSITIEGKTYTSSDNNGDKVWIYPNLNGATTVTFSAASKKTPYSNWVQAGTSSTTVITSVSNATYNETTGLHTMTLTGDTTVTINYIQN